MTTSFHFDKKFGGTGTAADYLCTDGSLTANCAGTGVIGESNETAKELARKGAATPLYRPKPFLWSRKWATVLENEKEGLRELFWAD